MLLTPPLLLLLLPSCLLQAYKIHDLSFVGTGHNSQGSIASIFSSYEYIRAGKVNLKLIGKIIPFVILGSGLGVLAVRFLPNEWLKPIIRNRRPVPTKDILVDSSFLSGH